MSISGDTIATWPASGRNSIYITNQANTNNAFVGGVNDNANFSAVHGLFTYNALYGYDQTADRSNRIRSTTSGSSLSANGTNFKLLTCVSGDTVNISGQSVVTSVSGNVVFLHQEDVGDPIVLAGQIVIPDSPTQLSNIPVSSGAALWNISIGQVVIGGIGSNTPSYTSANNYVGYLNGNPDKIFPITNLNQLSAVAEISGARLNYFAITISG